MTDCGHDHGLGDHINDRASGGRLIAAFGVIVVFMVVEVIGGIISGSLALLADAAHMMTDAFALALAASAHWMSRRPANRSLHFGYRRLQVLAAFINGIALIVLMGWIVYEAVRRAIHPIEVDWAPMLAVAALGLVANGIAFRMLHRAGENNINIRGALLHVASDLLGSVAAVAAAIVIWLSGWTRIDPILSVVVAVLIARSAYKLLRQTTHILLEGAPPHIDAEALAKALRAATPGVADIHNVKISQLTPEQVRLTLHARLEEDASAADALMLIKKKLETDYGVTDSTIQIESGGHCPDGRAHDHARDHDHDHGHAHEHGHGHGTKSAVRLRAVPGGAAAFHSALKD